MQRTSMACALALATLACATSPHAAEAASDSAAIEQIRAEIERMKTQYEARIEALEQRLAAAESLPQSMPAPGAAATAPGGGFNPDISLILGGAMTRQSRVPASYRIGGFVPAGDPEEAGPPRRRGYSLQESELSLVANVDPYVRGALTFSLSPDNTVSVEEAFAQSLGLPLGLNAKVGRFLSGIGYQNEQHAHAWDFADAPLAYAAFFGNRLVAEGAQLKWLAPTDTFLEFGLEAGRDDNFPGGASNRRGNGLGALFAHTGGDFDVSNSWRAGLSFVRSSPGARGYADVDRLGVATGNTFSGRSRTLVADFVWKWAPQGNAGVHNFKLAGEYFRRRETGSLSCTSATGSGGNCEGGYSDSYDSRQSGYYLQGVWQFAPQWRSGYRYDRLDSGHTAIGLVDNGVSGFNAAPFAQADFGALSRYRPRRHSLMVDWNPSEFSRLRFQLARDYARPDAPDNQVWLQYILSLGAHCAHKYLKELT